MRILRTDDAKALTTSQLQVGANAGRFYERLGFKYTGNEMAHTTLKCGSPSR